ncbi:MAG: 2'-5' RNA ligase family protein, partial [Candidatus Zixiibacteriota bacterium]
MALCYPRLLDKDYSLIQSVRKTHDMNYEMIEPHFSIVYPISDIDLSSFTDHCRESCRDFHPFSFEIRSAIVHKDIRSDLWYTFLVPDKGFSDIVRLHDRLYTGILAANLILEFTFIPHITVAHSKDGDVCKALADKLNEDNIHFAGNISSVDLIALESVKVRTMERIELK